MTTALPEGRWVPVRGVLRYYVTSGLPMPRPADITTSEPPSGEGRWSRSVDHAIVERVINGEELSLTCGERREVVRRLHAQGLSERQIQTHTGISARTVTRIRKELGLSGTPATRDDVA